MKLIFSTLILSYLSPKIDNVNNNNNSFLFMAPYQSKIGGGGGFLILTNIKQNSYINKALRTTSLTVFVLFATSVAG